MSGNDHRSIRSGGGYEAQKVLTRLHEHVGRGFGRFCGLAICPGRIGVIDQRLGLRRFRRKAGERGKSRTERQEVFPSLHHSRSPRKGQSMHTA